MVPGFSLTAEAERDIIEIARIGVRYFGEAQARRYHSDLFSAFEILAAYPQMARLRHEIAPPVHIHPFRSHLIVYHEVSAGGILVIRIRHGHEDWAAPSSD